MAMVLLRWIFAFLSLSLCCQAAPPRIVIVGGGLGGLSAAYDLTDYLSEHHIQADITILEKEPTLGGRIAFGPHHVDLGLTFIDSDQILMRDLAKKLDVKLYEFPTGPKNAKPMTYLFPSLDGADLDPAKLNQQWFSDPICLNVLSQIEFDIKLKESDGSEDAVRFQKLKKITTAEYLKTLELQFRNSQMDISQIALFKYIESTVVAFLGKSSTEISAFDFLDYSKVSVRDQSISFDHGHDEVLRVEGGSARLIEKLYQALKGRGVHIRQGHEVSSIFVNNPIAPQSSAKFTVQADTQFLPADFIISAVPAAEVPKILSNIPGFDAKAFSPMATNPYARVTKIFLFYKKGKNREPFWYADQHSGNFLIEGGGNIFPNSQKNQDMLTVYLSGPLSDNYQSLSQSQREAYVSSLRKMIQSELPDESDFYLRSQSHLQSHAYLSGGKPELYQGVIDNQKPQILMGGRVIAVGDWASLKSGGFGEGVLESVVAGVKAMEKVKGLRPVSPKKFKLLHLRKPGKNLK